ncbi:ATP-dependent DNA helicase PIF1 [Toxorhynchites rutilus septentrionalis]|uniref:ATP-dependent DNA helicase PIF1 n=1 Tax=Toxorhynchites rutilus septentrionalis TaxID=329112 RepID=UPI002479F1BF|nr:ATP-dependent DNA helicase PIF1 [Toxorhynchites rutilus septentrionalis]
MDPNDASLTCVTTVEWLNATGTTIKKVSYKQATLRLVRNTLQELFLEIAGEKAQPIKLKLKGINVHSKFMAEGKASIRFNEEKCTMFLSNAPPGLLVQFLKVIFVKVTGQSSNAESKQEMLKKTRAHLLSGKANQFDDVSPITNAELARARKLAIGSGSVTTPSPPQKRKRLSGEADRPPPKKLYAPSASLEPEVLNEEQKMVLNACKSGRSVFFTGSAGTGKSYLLRKIISTLPPDGTVATASTGVAACLIGGTTLHSFAGIGGGEAELQRCYEMAARPNSSQIWRKCKRLIIDEISMVDGDYFEKIEAVARYVRKSDKPFGGIQLILCGDFFQLPPVVKIDRFARGVNSQDNDKGVRFCFQTKAWKECVQSMYELTVVHRQKDPEFIALLNSIRIGRVTPEIRDRLTLTSKQKIETEGILATQLCSHTNDADVINQSKLNNLTGEENTFYATDSDIHATKVLDKQVQAPGKLVLKTGAQVMLLKNLNIAEGLVNGARGVVINYVQGYPLVKFKKRELLVKPETWAIKSAGGVIWTRSQLPLKLAWAFSIHKSQGLTLDCVEMSLSKVFEAGQAYVALSRAQSLDSVRILDFDGKQVWANPKVLEFYRDLRRQIRDRDAMAPVAVRKTAGGMKKSLSAMGLTKSMMSKPLVTIN